LKDAFFEDSVHNEKRISENDNTMFLSYRLLLKNGGYGYVTFQNLKTSDKAFVIDFEEE
jgi:hypothetical protein